MAKERELDERIERVEAIVEQLESGEPSPEDADQLHEEGHRNLEEIRDILERGDGEVHELPE